MIDLFRRNFDSDTTQPVTTAAVDEEEMNLRLAEARKSGFDAGRAVGKQDATTAFEAEEGSRLVAERQEICAQLDALIATDAQQAGQTENDIVELFLGIADRLVPEFLQSFGADLAVQRIRHSVALSRTNPVLSIFASPDVAAALEAAPGAWLPTSSEAATIKIVADAKLPKGAARVVWKGGKLEYDIETATNAVRSALQQAAVDLQAAAKGAEQ